MKETAIVSNFVLILKFKNLSVTSYRSFSQLMFQYRCVKFVYLLSGALYETLEFKIHAALCHFCTVVSIFLVAQWSIFLVCVHSGRVLSASPGRH